MSHHDPPNLMEFRDNMDNNSTCAQDSVNNTVKSVAHTNTPSNHNIQIHSANVNTPKSPQKPKLRRSPRLKAKISSATKSINKALKGNNHK